MLGKLKLRFKRHQLSKRVRAIEEYGINTKSWGANLATTMATTDIVINNIVDLLSQDSFEKHIHGKTIQSYFADIAGMSRWFNEVGIIINELAEGTQSSIPDDRKWLVLNDSGEVHLSDFIKSEGNIVDLIAIYLKMSKTLNSVSKSMQLLSPNMRGYVDMRLVNGFNTVVVFNEQLLEVMINGK